jgi:hypothetical protein
VLFLRYLAGLKSIVSTIVQPVLSVWASEGASGMKAGSYGFTSVHRHQPPEFLEPVLDDDDFGTHGHRVCFQQEKPSVVTSYSGWGDPK